MMKAITGIGIVVSIGGIMLGALMEGTNPVSLINIPALMIVGGGTIGITMASTSFKGFMTMPKLAIKAMKGLYSMLRQTEFALRTVDSPLRATVRAAVDRMERDVIRRT